MSDRLLLRIDGEYAVLPADYSVDVEDVSPIFGEDDSFTYDSSIPVEPNRHILSMLDSRYSQARGASLDGKKGELIVDGVVLRTGNVWTNDGDEIKDYFNFSLISRTDTISELVADMNCRDVPLKDKVQIGEMIGDVFCEVSFYWYLYWKSSGKSGVMSWGSTTSTGQKRYSTLSHTFQLQALGFSYPAICESVTGTETALQQNGKPMKEVDFINVTDEYPAKYYCNARVCYTHYKKEDDDTANTGSSVSTTEDFDPYYILDADRQQSGICFYVLYFLDCLFAHLAFNYDNSNLLTVGDLRRLCFFTTACNYDLERKYPAKGIVGVDENITYDFSRIGQINLWLSTRNTGGQLETVFEPIKKLESLSVDGKLYTLNDELENGQTLEKAEFRVDDVTFTTKANIMNMYANSQNFPDKGVQEVLDSLWASFGIKFLTNYEKRTVKPIFIRDVLRDNSDPIDFPCMLTGVERINEKTSGFRMYYSAESDAEEQDKNIKYGVTDYDTNFDYKDYRNVDTTLQYLQILKKGSVSDITCYIDKNTGNAYRIKVNKEATKVDELKPSIFEVGAFKGVEFGDCSSNNKDNILELKSSFEPVIFSDVNGKKEKSVASNETGYVKDSDSGKIYAISHANINDMKQILAVYIDDEMRHENSPYEIKNVMGNDYMDAYLVQKCTTDESYDPSNTEDGNSPLQHKDWGMSVAIMRGGGSDSSVQTYDYNYDGQGNSKWRTVAGEYALSSDCIDNWGNDYDYNGVIAGIGDDERFSLKIRAYKEINGEIACEEDEKDANGNVTRKVRSRGLYDSFMSDYANFVLHRKKLRITFRCEVAQLVNIQWDKRYKIDDMIFWFERLSYNVSKEHGLGEVEADIFIM